MEDEQLINILSRLSENNRTLIKNVLEPMIDELAFSDEQGKIYLKHNGVVGMYVEYEKALTLLKKLEIVYEFQNTRNGLPVKDGSIYAADEFEISYEENTLRRFDELINQNSLPPLPAATPPKSILLDNVKVEPRSYDHANGILTIAGKPILVIKQPNKRGKLHESKQAYLMRLLFSDVKSNFGATAMRTVVSVNPTNFTQKHRKLVKSYVSEINKKIYQEVEVKEFLLTNQYAVMINELYL